MSGDSNVTEQSSQVHLMAGKEGKQVEQSWCEGNRNQDTDTRRRRKRRDQKEAADGLSRSLWRDGESPYEGLKGVGLLPVCSWEGHLLQVLPWPLCLLCHLSPSYILITSHCSYYLTSPLSCISFLPRVEEGFCG